MDQFVLIPQQLYEEKFKLSHTKLMESRIWFQKLYNLFMKNLMPKQSLPITYKWNLNSVPTPIPKLSYS